MAQGNRTEYINSDVVLTNVEDNYYAKLLYEKPIIEKTGNIFKRFSQWRKQKAYTNNTIKPAIKKLRYSTPSFLNMCYFSDFIRILELVWFYRNEPLRDCDETGEIKIMSESDFKDPMKCKILILYIPNTETVIKFTMHRVYKGDESDSADKFDDIIKIQVNTNTGKKMSCTYTTINGECNHDSVHEYNQMYNITRILQNAMADLFSKYYYLITT